MARNYRGLTVSVIGAPERIPVSRLERALERRGAALSRRIETNTHLTVIAHGAVGRLAMGRLPTVIFQAGSDVLTEHQFLREIGLLPALPPKSSCDYDRTAFAAASRLTRKERFWLELFDVIEPREGVYDFHDLILARQVKSLIEAGVRLPGIIGAANAFRRAARRDAARQIGGGNAHGELVVRVGSWLAAIEDRQRLPFHERDMPLAGYLYDEAEAAEHAGEWAIAERLYRQCTQIDPSDAIAILNRAKAVREQGRKQEAAALLLAATEIDPLLGDAWYALARLAHDKGDMGDAEAHLQRTLLCEPDHADAAYELAVLYLDAGNMKRAAPLFDLAAREPDNQRARAARKAAVLCRMQAAAAAPDREAVALS